MISIIIVVLEVCIPSLHSVVYAPWWWDPPVVQMGFFQFVSLPPLFVLLT